VGLRVKKAGRGGGEIKKKPAVIIVTAVRHIFQLYCRTDFTAGRR